MEPMTLAPAAPAVPATPVTHALRAGLPPLPARIAKLPVDARGYPVPWFVAWVDGKPEFRAMDGRKFVEAIQHGRCWVCGQPLGHTFAFTVGPMCAVNRISAEPPSHRECAEFSAKACPFLTKPQMRRREGGLPDDLTEPGGISIQRNPGVALVWLTKAFRVIQDGDGKALIQMGPPREVLCFAEGRTATTDEIRASVDSGLPILQEAAARDGKNAVAALDKYVAIARGILGIAA
jgi:hypothetical protein